MEGSDPGLGSQNPMVLRDQSGCGRSVWVPDATHGMWKKGCLESGRPRRPSTTFQMVNSTVTMMLGIGSVKSTDSFGRERHGAIGRYERGETGLATRSDRTLLETI